MQCLACRHGSRILQQREVMHPSLVQVAQGVVQAESLCMCRGTESRKAVRSRVQFYGHGRGKASRDNTFQRCFRCYGEEGFCVLIGAHKGSIQAEIRAAATAAATAAAGTVT